MAGSMGDPFASKASRLPFEYLIQNADHLRLAAELGRIPNRIVVEGHTDAQPYSGYGTYSNWELSADRANQARHVMQAGGLRDGQVLQVRGFADQNLRDAAHPNSASNRRISVIVHYGDVRPPQEPEAKADPKAKSAAPAPPGAK